MQFAPAGGKKLSRGQPNPSHEPEDLAGWASPSTEKTAVHRLFSDPISYRCRKIQELGVQPSAGVRNTQRNSVNNTRSRRHKQAVE
jgi:hypothetical protein